LIYWYGAEVYLIDPQVAALSPAAAVALAVAFIVGSWLVYDGLCRSPLARIEWVFAAVLLLLVALLAWGLCQLFAGRAAYLHFGVVLGTIMVANVFFIIIPGQKEMVAAAARGAKPDPAPGIRGKQRSVHNTYFTLPVLFAMTSNHFAITYSHEFNWIILIAIALAGALIRVYFVARHKGRASLAPVIIAVLVLIAVIMLVAPRPGAALSGNGADFAAVRRIVHERCTNCHSAQPVHAAFPSAPAGVMFDSDAEIRNEAQRIHQQTVVTRVMPIGNLTSMSEDERQVIDDWYQDLAMEKSDD
jgi:uncharacterized membrane protein